MLDMGILYSGDTNAPYDQVTLDTHTASPFAEAYLGAHLLVNGEQRTISCSLPASNVSIAGASSTNDILQLSSSLGASTSDYFYIGWTAHIFNASEKSFETRLIIKYEGSNLTAQILSPLSYGQPYYKLYSIDGARIVKMSAPFLLPIFTEFVADTTNAKDIRPDIFSTRWEGMDKVDHSDVCTFSIYCDNGARLYINDLLISDHWHSRISEFDGAIALVSGTMYPFRLEYKQVTGNASGQLR